MKDKAEYESGPEGPRLMWPKVGCKPEETQSRRKTSHTGGHTMGTFEQLAQDIDTFFYDYDFYGYSDAFDTREAGLQAVMENLTEDRQSILTWLEEWAQDEDEEFTKRALELIERVKSLDE